MTMGFAFTENNRMIPSVIWIQVSILRNGVGERHQRLFLAQGCCCSPDNLRLQSIQRSLTHNRLQFPDNHNIGVSKAGAPLFTGVLMSHTLPIIFSGKTVHWVTGPVSYSWIENSVNQSPLPYCQADNFQVYYETGIHFFWPFHLKNRLVMQIPSGSILRPSSVSTVITLRR